MHPAPHGDGTHPAAIADRLATFAAIALAAIACFRAIVGFEPMPWFSSDPFESQVFVTGLTPAHAYWLDVAAITLSGLGLIAASLSGLRLRRILMVLSLAGSIIAMWWVVEPSKGNTIDSMRFGFAWTAAIWSAVALAHLAQCPRRRALTLALLLSVVAMLVAKGVVQVAVEHADTVAWYERDPETFLRAHGWEPGSAQARGYERRLYQAEATGWFGLSNVYATLVGSAAVAAGAMAIGAAAQKPRPVRPAAILTVGTGSLMALVGLWLCGSKGGAVAAAAGAAFLVLAAVASRLAASSLARTRRARTALALGGALAVLITPLAAVVGRGMVGERLGELSLLFRSFYMHGAARIVADAPLFGVGPSGFRDAYLMVRPPLGVEDPVSPHAIVWDLLTGFGLIGGAAWLMLVTVLVAGSIWPVLDPSRGREHADQASDHADPAEGAGTSDDVLMPAAQGPSLADDTKMLALVAILATALAATIERVLTTPETAALRLCGLIGWVALAWGLLAVARRSPRALSLGAAGACVTALVHAGIEVTPTWVGAQSWFFAVLGVGGAGAMGLVREGQRPSTGPDAAIAAMHSPRRLLAPALIGLGVCVLVWLSPARVLTWQSSLRSASTLAADVGRMNDQLRVLQNDPALAVELRMTLDDARAELASLVSARPAGSPEEFERQMEALIETRSLRSLERLDRAGVPSDVPTRRAADRVAQRLASLWMLSGKPQQAAALLDQRAIAASSICEVGRTVVLCSHIGGLRSQQAEALDLAGLTEQAQTVRLEAIWWYEMAAGYDPRGVHHPLRAARLSVRLGDADRAMMWAELALENQANTRLDPLMGLTEAEVAEMRSILGPPGS